MVKCAVVGASGYIGGEVTRLLLQHPNIELVAVTAKDNAGKKLSDVHPSFLGVPLTFGALTEVGEAEVVFLALPNGETMKLFANGNPFRRSDGSGPRLIDTSSDFRLRDKAEYERFYKAEHVCFDAVREFTYGQPELFPSQVAEARHISAPGCFATATILALYPLVAAGVHQHIVVNAVTGSSGAGVKAKETTHHPFRADSYFAYETFTHRHQPEVKQALRDRTGNAAEFVFQPHSGPFVRGIFATAVVALKSPLSNDEVKNLYAEAYHGKPFVRLVSGSPNIKHVQGTNFCDIGVRSNGETAIVMAAIDNLVKGGAGQAVQCFNLMHGFEETAGLHLFSPIP